MYDFAVYLQTGQRHYKEKYLKLWLPVTICNAKSRNNALHAFCGIETIEPAAPAAATKRVFLHHKSFPRANLP